MGGTNGETKALPRSRGARQMKNLLTGSRPARLVVKCERRLVRRDGAVAAAARVGDGKSDRNRLRLRLAVDTSGQLNVRAALSDGQAPRVHRDDNGLGCIQGA